MQAPPMPCHAPLLDSESESNLFDSEAESNALLDTAPAMKKAIATTNSTTARMNQRAFWGLFTRTATTSLHTPRGFSQC